MPAGRCGPGLDRPPAATGRKAAAVPGRRHRRRARAGGGDGAGRRHGNAADLPRWWTPLEPARHCRRARRRDLPRRRAARWPCRGLQRGDRRTRPERPRQREVGPGCPGALCSLDRAPLRRTAGPVAELPLARTRAARPDPQFPPRLPGHQRRRTPPRGTGLCRPLVLSARLLRLEAWLARRLPRLQPRYQHPAAALRVTDARAGTHRIPGASVDLPDGQPAGDGYRPLGQRAYRTARRGDRSVPRRPRPVGPRPPSGPDPGRGNGSRRPRSTAACCSPSTRSPTTPSAASASGREPFCSPRHRTPGPASRRTDR